jgi:hypothetical protein
VSGGNAVQDPFASTRWVTKRMSSWMIPDGDVVSVTGGDSLFALMALADDALPNEDDRKLTVTDVAVLRILMELISESGRARSDCMRWQRRCMTNSARFCHPRNDSRGFQLADETDCTGEVMDGRPRDRAVEGMADKSWPDIKSLPPMLMEDES